MTPKSKEELRDQLADIQLLTGLNDKAWYKKFGNTKGLYGLFTSYHQQQLEQAVREAQLKMANNLIDQERKLYKIFDDDKQICVGIKEMADEVREYYDGGIYAKN